MPPTSGHITRGGKDIIFGVADRITVLDNRPLLAEGTPDDIAANPTVQAAT